MNKISLCILIVGIFWVLFSNQSIKAATSSTVTKHPAATFSGSIDLSGNTDHIYQFTNDVSIGSPSSISGSRTGVIFIKGNLTIGPMSGNKLQYGNSNSGLVFVVSGNVSIDPSVTQVDAVIISEGIIYTAGTNCTTSSVSTSSPLVINGSLISLKQPDLTQINPPPSIRFCRTFGNNSQAAEVINHQIKYLVLLRDLVSDTLQKWTEIDANVPIPSPAAACISNGSCNAAAPACGQATTGVDNCGKACSKIGPACLPSPTVDLKANNSDGPISIAHNSSATLSWSTGNSPTSCSASGDWSGAKSTTGSTESTNALAGPSTKTYTLTCSNEGGSNSDSVTVNVNAPPPPTAISHFASNVTLNSATLNAEVNPNGSAANVRFSVLWNNSRSGNTPPCTSLGYYGNVTAGSGTQSVIVTQPATSLDYGTTYTFCYQVSSTAGGPVYSPSYAQFTTTSAPAPSVTTSAASSVNQNSATLNSSVNPNGYATTVLYWWGNVNTNCSDLAVSTGSIAIGSGTSAVSPNAIGLSGLSPSTTYYYCAIANNVGGTVQGTNNSQATLSFTTAAAAPPPPPPTPAPTPPPPPPTTYTLAENFSSTQGPMWYYYYVPYVGSPFPGTYGNTGTMQPVAWYGQPSNNYWYDCGGCWGMIAPSKVTGGDTNMAVIYWKAPGPGTAVMTVTQTKTDACLGNGYKIGVGYASSVGVWPSGFSSEATVGNCDQTQKTLTKTQSMNGGDALVYYDDAFNWTYFDAATYAISVTFTP